MGYSRWLRLVAISGLALFGIAILLNPLYLHPDGGGAPERTYHVAQIEHETMAQQALGLSEDVLGCPNDRLCVLEQTVLEEDTVDTEVYIHEDDHQWYSVVQFAEDTYVPEERLEANRTVLTLEEVDEMEAVGHAAVPVEERSEAAREAVETGSVTVYGERVESFERGEILEYDGDYYYKTGYRGSSSHWSSDLPAIRALLVFFGSGLVAYSGWRARGFAAKSDSSRG